MMQDAALFLAFAGMLPLMIYLIWSDLKFFKIPNWLVLTVFGLFLVTGSWGLPTDVFLWRIAHALIVLVVGFFLYTLASGAIGAGDVKLISAFTPFIPGAAIGNILLLYVLTSILSLLVLLMCRRMFRDRATDWKGFSSSRYFPAGVFLGLTILIFMGLQVLGRLTATV